MSRCWPQADRTTLSGHVPTARAAGARGSGFALETRGGEALEGANGSRIPVTGFAPFLKSTGLRPAWHVLRPLTHVCGRESRLPGRAGRHSRGRLCTALASAAGHSPRGLDGIPPKSHPQGQTPPLCKPKLHDFFCFLYDVTLMSPFGLVDT